MNIAQIRHSAPQANAGRRTATALASEVPAVVAAIDKALGNDWSFNLIHHEVVGDETIVFTNVEIDGRHWIGIGGTSGTGTLAERLNEATIDALGRAAEWMEIVHRANRVP